MIRLLSAYGKSLIARARHYLKAVTVAVAVVVVVVVVEVVLVVVVVMEVVGK